MANPVMHFEIMAKGYRKRTQEFYTQLFGWHVDDDNPMNYGMVDTHSDGAGIGGGISGDGHYPNVTIYVGVDDLQAALDKAESLGGKTVAPPPLQKPGRSLASSRWRTSPTPKATSSV